MTSSPLIASYWPALVVAAFTEAPGGQDSSVCVDTSFDFVLSESEGVKLIITI